MSETTSCRPSIDPGIAAVTPSPKMIDASDPGGVICTTRKSSPTETVGIETGRHGLPVDARLSLGENLWAIGT